MGKRTAYQQGTPNWVELHTTDQAGAKSFYGRLFGWRFRDVDVPAEVVNGRSRYRSGLVYSMAHQRDGVVAAIVPGSPEPAGRGVPAAWHTYLAVDDVDATARAVPGAGGTLVLEPRDVLDAGRMAVALDPTGAEVRFWQARRHIGATVVNEPGAVGWNELLTDDVATAAGFYQRVLGVEAETVELSGVPWTSLRTGDGPVAGVIRKRVPGLPNRWNVYFATRSAHATAHQAIACGGTVVIGPVDTMIGPMVGLRDPQGALFSAWTPVAAPV